MACVNRLNPVVGRREKRYFTEPGHGWGVLLRLGMSIAYEGVESLDD